MTARLTVWVGLAIGGSLVAAGSAQTLASEPALAAASLADFTWLAGHWSADNGTSTTEEQWTRPAANAMLGLARTLRDGRMIEFEYLRLVQRDNGLVYVAQPGGRPPTEFRLTAFDRHTATFENPRHDFPKRLVYRRHDDGLHVTVDGGPASPGRAIELHFRRTAGR
jgi:hypothetical protein